MPAKTLHAAHKLLQWLPAKPPPRITAVRRLFWLIPLLLMGSVTVAQKDGFAPEDLKKMSLEELMGLEVSTVSKRPQKLSQVASAIQVISQEDIRRSAATSLPELLRLVTNLQVAQVNSHSHIISARGFNAAFSNKLLVMIDGRTVYSPLFAGVFWDAQQVSLEDIEQIEVVSGPGGTLWGANAVNGVINVITKNAKETEGLLISGSAGSYLGKSGRIRYGAKLSPDLSFRLFAQHDTRNHTYLADGTEGTDRWGISLGGFRMDWTPSTKDVFTFQGQVYRGEGETLPDPSTLDGQHLLSRWTRSFSDRSGIMVQAYFDRTWRRDIPSTLSDELHTYNLDIQYNFPLGTAHRILVGGGYRSMRNHTINSTDLAGILPNRRNLNLFGGFVQDDIQVHPEITLTVGTKVQHNFYTGIEVQPSSRIGWTPTENQVVWGAVSRAVRTPSRIDVDYFLPTYPLPPEYASVAGGPNFVSEKVMAYELGYRISPERNLRLSLAAFYNQYRDLYSVEALPGTLTYQIQNGTEGRSWGTEFSGTWQVSEVWRLKGGYTYFNKELQNKPGRVYDFSALGYDAKHQGLLNSSNNLPGNLQFDVSMRYLGELSGIAVPGYFSFDANITWMLMPSTELSLVGQNLWEKRHVEILNQIPRSLYGKVICRF